MLFATKMISKENEKKKKNEEEIRRKNQTYFFSKLLTSVTSLKLFGKTIIFLKF